MACTAIGALAANAAQAGWTIEASKLVGSETVGIFGGPLTLTTEVFGMELEVEAGSIECTAGVECTIDNTTKEGHGTSLLTMTSVKVKKPLGCTVNSPGEPAGTVATKKLTDEVIMDPTAGSTAVFDSFFPEAGTTLFELEFKGEFCVLKAVEFPVSGTLAGETVHAVGAERDIPTKTGELSIEESLTFSQSMEKTGGGLLYLGTIKTTLASFDATFTRKPSGANAAKKFAVD